MACACGAKNGSTGKSTFTVQTPDGKKSYSTEVEAAAAARRYGTSYTQTS